jgi:predicted Zn-dependent peptidase
VCSGKITPHVKEQLVNAFQNFHSDRHATPVIQTPVPTVTDEFLKKENSLQASIRLGKHSIPRLHPDYPSLLLLNHILGGYFGSRLMKNIREEKGLTYGIYSSIAALKHNSYVSIGTDVNIENRDLAIEEIKNELKHLRVGRISQSELEIARNHFIGSLQAEITTPFAHADKIKSILLHDLPGTYYQNLIHKIESLTNTDLQETARKYFDENSFSVVAVG